MSFPLSACCCSLTHLGLCATLTSMTRREFLSVLGGFHRTKFPFWYEELFKKGIVWSVRCVAIKQTQKISWHWKRFHKKLKYMHKIQFNLNILIFFLCQFSGPTKPTLNLFMLSIINRFFLFKFLFFFMFKNIFCICAVIQVHATASIAPSRPGKSDRLSVGA